MTPSTVCYTEYELCNHCLDKYDNLVVKISDHVLEFMEAKKEEHKNGN